MAKIQNISKIHPTLGFTEFDILEKYRKSFKESELGRLHSVFPFECMAKAADLSDRRLGRRNIFSPSAKIALMVGEYRNAKSVADALLEFSASKDKPNGKIEISDITLGYNIVDFDTSPTELQPVWRITLKDGSKYYINA